MQEDDKLNNNYINKFGQGGYDDGDESRPPQKIQITPAAGT